MLVAQRHIILSAQALPGPIIPNRSLPHDTPNATCAGDGSACAVAAEDDAEWVPGGVDEDPEPRLRLT